MTRNEVKRALNWSVIGVLIGIVVVGGIGVALIAYVATGGV